MFHISCDLAGVIGTGLTITSSNPKLGVVVHITDAQVPWRAGLTAHQMIKVPRVAASISPVLSLMRLLEHCPQYSLLLTSNRR